MPPLTKADVEAIATRVAKAWLDRLNNLPLGLGGLRRIGTGATDAAPGDTVAALLALDILVRTASTTLTAERVVTDTSTVTWDWATAGQAKANVIAAPWSGITGTPTTLSGYGITDAVPSSRTVSTTAPLTGGGALSGNLTLAISAASGSAAGTMSTADFTKLAALGTSAFTATVATTDAAVTTVATPTIPDNTTSMVTAWVRGYKSDGTQGGAYLLSATFRSTGAVVTQVGATTQIVVAEDDAAWNATITAAGLVQVTGVAATNIAWTCNGTVM